MPVVLYGGTEKIESLKHSQPLFLIHGGAGPADPRGADALDVEQVIERIASNIHKKILPEKNIQLFNLTNKDATESEIACITAAFFLENEHRFNAGLGAALQDDGAARVSASFMESTREKFSAVMNAEDVIHPSALAYYLQSSRFCVLDSRGAAALAHDLKVPRENLITVPRFEVWAKNKVAHLKKNIEAELGKGTIGCVAVDAQGNLSAVTSTGGVGNETAGRVGDTPTVAGNYCSKKVAVSCTGYGEQILNQAFAVRVAVRVEDGFTLHDALKKGLEEADAKGYEFAAICVSFDSKNNTASWAAGTTEPCFIWAAQLPSELKTFVRP